MPVPNCEESAVRVCEGGADIPVCPRALSRRPEPIPELVEGPAKGLLMVYGLPECGHFDKLNDHAFVGNLGFRSE